jgi:hypothetical protein
VVGTARQIANGLFPEEEEEMGGWWARREIFLANYGTDLARWTGPFHDDKRKNEKLPMNMRNRTGDFQSPCVEGYDWGRKEV